MFTGIIKGTGIIKEIVADKTNKTFWIKSDITPQLQIDESVCHNGVCLTIEDIHADKYRVTAIHETIDKTNIGDWESGDMINLERSMQMNGRIDGHIVQGHIDGKGTCLAKKDFDGSYEYTFSFNEKFASLIIEKGSICVNGVSLTAFNVSNNSFTVAIIPYTFSHTNFQSLEENETVNLEFDILGKYVTRSLSLKNNG